MSQDKKVLLFGRSGAGKSAVGNALVTGGVEIVVFPSSGGASPCTSDIKKASGRGWTVTDTMEFGLDGLSKTEAWEFLTQFLTKVKDEYSHIIFVQRRRFTEQDEISWLFFQNLFVGAEEAFVVLFTGEDESWLEENKSKFPSSFAGVKTLVVNIPPIHKRPTLERRLKMIRGESTSKLEADLEEMFLKRESKYAIPAIARMSDVQLEETIWSLINSSFKRRTEHRLMRNSRDKSILAGLLTVPKVQATFSKVYICGNPYVGKTTLCRTLQSNFWKSLFTWDSRPHVETQTRGIDISELSSKGNKPDENLMTLLVWDMAGQEDFHLVHNAFFPDLGFTEGNATTFIVVCSSKSSLQNSMEQLKYWLRYIASSCDKTIQNRRHVFVVLNNIGGSQKMHAEDWKTVLESQRVQFKQHLELHTDLFLVDVRKFQQVDAVKRCLLEHSRNLLRNQRVPQICHAIQKNLSVFSQQREQFPVLLWTEFVEQVVHQLQERWSEHTIKAATKYLNEAGVVIYIDTEEVKLVVLDPSWFCREILGKVFLPRDIASPTELLFREQVHQRTGSISMVDFKKFFKSLKGEWNDAQVDHLTAILLWLGLCYKGKEENIFWPALIAEQGTPGDPWCPKPQVEHIRDQWVMGFSVRHHESEVALAPISLWHKFQVDLAQTPKFNNGERLDNNFVADKYFVSFIVDHMNVLIEVDANLDKPTFEEISILVKPRFEYWFAATERKQHQVDLADDLVERLLKLWDQVCPGVEYEQKVIWPWPASWSRPRDKPERNFDVANLKRWVQENGVGIKMQWDVGSGDPITADQLLPTKDKRDMERAMGSGDLITEDKLLHMKDNRDVEQLVEHIVTQRMEEAVKLGIFPPDALTDEAFSDELGAPSDGTDMPTSSSHEKQDEMFFILNKELKSMNERLNKGFGNVENLLRDGFGEVLKKQKQVLRKIQDTERMFKEDGQSICPKFIYVGTSDSRWVSLKDALRLSTTVRLRFACEARYDNYRPHVDVENQQGFDVSQLEGWARTILPWLKVSLTVLFISAKVAANVVAPGLGLILPTFVDWQQTATLSDGLALATGFSKDQLDQMIQGTGRNANDVHGDAEGLYRKSRKVISELLGKLPKEEFEKKIGLRKVRLDYDDGTLHGVVWICTACLKKIPRELVSELE